MIRFDIIIGIAPIMSICARYFKTLEGNVSDWLLSICRMKDFTVVLEKK